MEDKIDSVKEDVIAVKTEVSEMKSDIKHHMKKVEEHVAGDKKIINEIQPILAKLPQIVEMAEEYHVSKRLKERTIKLLGIIGMLVGIASGLSKMGII
jgi:hypothetical protein